MTPETTYVQGIKSAPTDTASRASCSLYFSILHYADDLNLKHRIEMEAPIVKTIETLCYGDADIVKYIVQCPYCPKTHQHGGGYRKNPDTLPAWRASHCGKGEYKIVLLE